MSGAGFIRGMMAGAAIGAVTAIMFDPISPRMRKRMKRRASGMFRGIGGMMDDFMGSR